MYNNDINNSKIINFKPNNLTTMDTVNNNINFSSGREEKHLNFPDFHLKIDFITLDYADGVTANNAKVRLANCCVSPIYSSFRFENISCKEVEYLNHCHPNLIMFKLLISTDYDF